MMERYARRRIWIGAWALCVAIGPSLPAGAAELPKATQKAMADLKLDNALLSGLDAELDVPAKWIEAAKQEKDVVIAGTWEPREFRDMTIFVLHDGDLDGYNIARTLGEETARMPDHNIAVIDLGLTVPQAIAEGLETESFTRRKELPTDLELDPAARQWFTGEVIRGEDGEPVLHKGKTQYATTRCELNAFSSDELAEFIEAGLNLDPPTWGVVGRLAPWLLFLGSGGVR